MEQRILITGGTGFIGKELCRKLHAKGYLLTVLSRQSTDIVRSLCGPVEATDSLQHLEGHSGFDAIINLAGEGIAEKRWNEERKNALRNSRIGLTRELVKVAESWQTLPAVMVSGSAVGYYGDQGSQLVTEETSPNDEFTHRLCRDWENEALALEKHGVRICLSRTGVVAGPNGGFLQQMLPPFKLGLGGPLGSGEQYMPWVHRTDVVNGLIWMLETTTAHGPYNMVSPNPATNREFTKTLASVLHRPALIPMPAPALRVAMGEMARLLLTGQKAIPERLQKEGFEFQYPELEQALKDSVKK